jgi:hypothetical protein
MQKEGQNSCDNSQNTLPGIVVGSISILLIANALLEAVVEQRLIGTLINWQLTYQGPPFWEIRHILSEKM